MEIALATINLKSDLIANPYSPTLYLQMNYSSYIRSTLIVTLCVILLGAYTRLADAGLGCPDWPGCYGTWLVPDKAADVTDKAYLEQRPLETAKGWLEMIHRYVAGTLGLLIAGLAVWSWQRTRQQPQQPVWLATSLLGLVIVQALLGMWTVTLLLKPVVVMAHLLGGFSILALLFVLLLRVHDDQSRYEAPRLRRFAALCFIVLIGQIALGGWTSTNYAALACTDFPTCQGTWWPPMDFAEGFVLWRGIGINYEFGVLEHPARTAIHMAHRIGALVTVVCLGSFVVMLLRSDQPIAMLGLRIGLVLCVQVILGICNVLFHLPLWVAVAHNVVAAILLLTVIQANYVLRPLLIRDTCFRRNDTK